MGAWVLYGLGTENQNLPGFIAMCPGGLPIKDTENWQSAFLPGVFQGTYVDSQHQQLQKLIENIEHPHVTTADQRRQLDLLSRWNAKHRQARQDDRLDARIHSYELAFRMQADAAEAFDLSREPQHVLQMYGQGVHARQTLIARRLVERGVRYVQLWHGASQPWDNHDNIAGNHRNLATQIDQPIDALLTDLKQRGMLDETLVLWGGEFGRTPTVELGGDGNPKNGRDHNHYGFSVWLAGGGIKGGTVYGATDEFGFKAAENPASVHDLHATMLHLLGFDHEKLTYRYAGRDFRLTDVHGKVIKEIVA
jgi:arylsulfatase A-like enzyme